MLTSKFIKETALKLGAADVGIGDIKYFANEIPQRDPKMILPDAKCVIGFAFRVPRAYYYAMKEEKQFYQYGDVGVKYIDEELSEIFLLKMGGIIEDAGFDACLQRNVSNLKIKGDKTTNPEVIGTYELVHVQSVSKDKVAPEIIIDFNKAAVICNLGSIGASGHLISPKLGPFLRLVFIVTDAPLECDEPFKGNLCDNCNKCMTSCPGKAISPAGLNTWQCAVYYRGAHKSNPFMTDDFLENHPNKEAIINGDYVFDSKTALEIYPHLDFLPSRVTRYMPCLCGKKCDIACYEHLKEKGIL